MIKRLLLFLLVTTFVSASDLSQESKPATVRVLLTKLEEEALVEVRGRYLIYNPKDGELITTGTKKKRAKVKTGKNGIYWDEEFDDIYEIRIVPNEPSASILVGGIQYKGCIEIYSIGGTINIVNEVDTENYLKSILSPKISQKFSPGALDAIAITERTNLYYAIQRDSFASWQAEADKVGYTGLFASRQNTAVQAAIDRTRGLILNYKKKPFAASWSLDNAGRIVTFNSIFRKNCTVPKGVDHLPSLNEREKHKWKASVASKNLAKLINLTEIHEIDLFRAEKSKKVYAVRLKGPEGIKDISFFSLQKLIGENIIPSNDFNITLKGKKIYFVGYGKGIGTGLCALSAEILSRRKQSTEKILLNHFPDTELINLRLQSGQPPSTSFIWN